MASSAPQRLVSMATAQRLIYGIGALLMVAVVAMQVAMFDPDDYTDISWPRVAVILGLMIVADQVVISLVIRRQTMTFNIIEIPLLLSFFWLPPLAFAVLRIPMTLFRFVTQLRLARIKVFLNICVAYFELTLATFIFHQLGFYDPSSPWTWIAAYAALIPANVLGAAAVALAINLAQARMSAAEWRTVMISVLGADLTNPTVGLIVILALAVNPWSAVLLVMLGLLLVGGYRMYSVSLSHFRTVEELYEFTSAIDAARHDGSFYDTLLTRARVLVGAEQATLWIPAQGKYPEVSLVAREGDVAVTDDQRGTDLIRQRVVETGATIAASTMKSRLPNPDRELRNQLHLLGFKDVIAVPLRSGSAIIGCLEIAGRLGELSTFTPDEVKLAETLAAHAGVAVENSRLLDRLRFDAYHDALTGLANRRRFQAAVEAGIQVRPAPGEVVAVMQFDVDSLREVNETLGHESGDRLLIEVGKRLRERAPDGALVARLGGDEFAVLLRAEGPDAAQASALSMQYALVEPMRLDKFTLDVGASVGIAFFPEHGGDAATLMQRADVASFAAKHNPRSIQVYLPAMEQRSLHRISLVSELRRAIDDDELTLYYQPKVAIAERRVIGMECLLRWEHPEHGLISPDEFIPVAEHTGLVGALTRHVLDKAITQGVAWHRAGRTIGISVNLSPRNLVDPDLPDELAAMLAEAELPADFLTLEITETAMANEVDPRADRPLPGLKRLHELGVRLAVDDFGTGYSALSYLRNLPIQEVKIDKTFVLGMATEPADLAIVRAVVDLGRHLGITVVAEGVESETTLTLLREIGCEVAQGFFFARPLPLEKIEAWLDVHTDASDGPTYPRLVTG